MQAFLSNNAVKVIEAVIWPAAVALVLLVYRRPLVKVLTQRVSKISWAGFSLELATAVRPETWHRVALLKEPTAQPVVDSGQALTQLIEGGERADSAHFDLGRGHEWLTTRLYLFARVLPQVLGVRCLVFLDARGGVPRRYVGLADPDAVRKALAARYDWLERAFADAQLGRPGVPPTREALLDVLRSADLTRPGAAQPVAERFLENPAIRRERQQAEDEEPGWLRLGETQPGKVREEHGEWIQDGAHLVKLLGDVLKRPLVERRGGISTRELQRRAILEQGDFVAVVDDEGRFRQLLNRPALADALAREVADADAP